MKKLMFVAVLCTSMLAFAQETEPAKPAKETKTALVAKRNAAQAKLVGMSTEEFAKLTPAERREKVRAARKAARKPAKAKKDKKAKMAEAPAEEAK